MVTTMTEPNTERPCARGCVRTGTEDNPQNLPARHGNYCSRCWGRINQALIQAPELAQHILGNVVPSGGGQDSERIDSSKEAPLPFNDSAFADVNELYSMLVYWCGIWSDYLEQLRPAPAARAWRRDSGTVTGLPSGITPARAHHEVGRMTRWLRDRLDDILTLAAEDVDEFDTAIRDVWRMNARWPRIEKARYADMPCQVDDCGRRIAVFPPAYHGDVTRIVCDAGHFYPPEEYEHHMLVFAQARQEQARAKAREAGRTKGPAARRAQSERERAARVVAHLMEKYGDLAG